MLPRPEELREQGGGVEAALTENISIKGEYLYVDLDVVGAHVGAEIDRWPLGDPQAVRPAMQRMKVSELKEKYAEERPRTSASGSIWCG